MSHLSTAELLLLAEGELDEVRAAHAAGCADCQAASGRALDELGAITEILAESAVADSGDAKAESWVRFRAALEAPAPQHVEIEDLLLHLDGEMVPTVSDHLEDCTDCHDELLRAQTLLVDVEHELRALIPEETKQQRLASASRLEKALDSRRSRVLAFPAPWRAVYAAAALLAAGLFGFGWYAQQPAQMTLPMVAMAPAAPPVFLTPSVEDVSPPLVLPQAATQARREIAVAAIEVAPARFAAGSTALANEPVAKALEQENAPLVALSMEPVALPLASLPKLEAPAVEADAPLIAREPSKIVVRDRPVGGLVRSALLEHYGDAARRSFRSARPDLLEGELARYVSEILHADSELLRHAYALNEMLGDVERNDLDTEQRERLRSEAREALSTIRSEEQKLYTKLSEALPRRYWASKGARDNELDAQDLASGSDALLTAALELDKNLSAVLVNSESSVNFEPETASVGDLLYIVRVSSRNLQERLSVLR